MSDYDVDLHQLRDFGVQMRGIAAGLDGDISPPALDGFAEAMAGGVAAQASPAAAAAWLSGSQVLIEHLAAHPDTVVSIADAYLKQAEDAQTAITGFFERTQR